MKSLAPKNQRNEGSMSAFYSSPALYAKQPVLLPTERLLVFLCSDQHMFRHTGERRLVFIFIFCIHKTVVISILLTALTVTLRRTSFPAVSACVGLHLFCTHPRMCKFTHTRTYTTFSRCELIDSRLSVSAKMADQCLIRWVKLSHSSV